MIRDEFVLREDEMNRLMADGGAPLKGVRDETLTRITARDRRVLIEGTPEAVSAARLRIEEILSGSPLETEGIAPRTSGQEAYVEAMSAAPLVLCVGPAGTGKTFLAVMAGIDALQRGEVSKLILVRPAVEAGERLGFLPGDIQAKVDPYLRPIYDALERRMSFSRIRRYIENDIFEIAPLAFMRGRTLERAFVILDEAQNTTRMQMKMFLTRLGPGSRAVVTGDLTQVDLAPDRRPGLAEALELLEGVEGIRVARLTSSDVVRPPIVRRIVEAYHRGTRDENGPCNAHPPARDGD